MSRNVLLGVSGGIAAYKACELVRAFRKRGDRVRVILTEGAQEFVTPLTLQVLSENPVGTTTFDPTYESEIGHIDLARWADVVLLAPATANLVGQIAHGLATDLLTTVLLATRAPVVVAPAMNTAMYLHPRVQANLKTVAEISGYSVVEPDRGELACKETGPGRLPDPPVLLDAVDRAGSDPLLAGKRVLITAGPTREAIDPARFISNPSSGRMGYALAHAARALGAEVTLVSGPVNLSSPLGVHVISVTTAREMYSAVMSVVESMDYAAFVAAVADWRPASEEKRKRKKDQMQSTLELVRNPDILAEVGARFGVESKAGPVVIGFAAETDRVVEEGRAKLARKKAHMIVANRIGGGDLNTFGSERASVHVITRERVTDYGAQTKQEIGFRIWEEALRFRRGEKSNRLPG